MSFWKYTALLIICFCLSLNLKAQKYYFQHYGIGDGLAQSQVTSICQDKNKQIWLTTLGGINCFDSKQFSALSIDDGLPENACNSIMEDNNGQLWAGSGNALTVFRPNGAKNYKFIDKRIYKTVKRLLFDKNNNIWAQSGYKLFKLVKDSFQNQTVVTDDDMITCVKKNKQGEVYAAISMEGIYKLELDQWKLVCKLKNNPDIAAVRDFVVDEDNPNLIYFITSIGGLYTSKNGEVQPIYQKQLSTLRLNFDCLLLDNDHGIWVGMDKGACLLKNGGITYFNEKNGFTDLRVFCMYRDVDDHIWFGTDGAGLIKYQNNALFIFDKSQGLDNDVVMNMAKGNDDEVFIGGNGGRLVSYKGAGIIDQKFPLKEMQSPRITCLFKDSQNNLWVGTDNAGLWVRKKTEYVKVFPQKSDHALLFFSHITEDSDHTVWFTSSNGCYYLKNDSLKRIPDLYTSCHSITQIGKDSILIGTMDGVKLIRNKKIDDKFQVLGNNLINCLEYKKPFLLLGTNDRGLYIYNMQTRQTQHISAKDGLASNIVYSVLLVNNQLWTGTGRGVNKYFFTIDGNQFKVSPAPLANLAFETNQNAILLARNSVWIGTTNGINVYPLNGNPQSVFTPKTVIQHVQTYTKNPDELKYLFSGGYRLPTALAIPSAESHISIKFQGIDFSSAKIQYQYMLEGLETTYGRPVENTFVDYPQLPPGNYVFKVKAIMPNGSAGSITSYAFEVTPAFYQTIAFKIFIILLLTASVIGIFWYKSYKDRMERDFVERVKLHEQEHVRRQTAEDFHDDLGNKLTRINMLSELLEKKMPHGLKEERKITEQIRSSAVEMYSGTKNILWALNPKNDNLSEITKELEKFGNSLYDGMNIRFKVLPCDGELSDIKLPLGYSHNVTLIFRELMNNILKHAHAKTVTFWCKISSYNQFCLMITDDGIGYCANELNEGHGLKNIQNRAQKLNGQLEICSKPGKGTSTKLIVTLT